jgi:hypothetical protein
MNEMTDNDTPTDAEVSPPTENEVSPPAEVEVSHEERPAPPLPPPPPRPESRTPLPSPQPTESWSKSPALAAFLSMLPGLGHLYVGVYQRAAMLVIGFFAIIYLLPIPINIFLCLFVWFFGIFDAYRQAQLANLGDSDEAPVRRGESTLMFGVFLTVLGAILLLNNLFPIDFEWLRDWWPAIVVVAGLYLIISAALDRRRRTGTQSSDMPDFLE